jgi:hypothetical protein
VGGDEMAAGGSGRGASDFILSRGHGLGWISSDEIGRRGRCSGAARWTGSSHPIGGVGGGSVQSELARFQCGSDQNRACWGRLDRLGGRAWVARRRALDAVHGHVHHEANARVCARECEWRSRRPRACGAWSERGSGLDLQLVWSAGDGWVARAVVCGARWRGSRPWLPFYASAQ